MVVVQRSFTRLPNRLSLPPETLATPDHLVKSTNLEGSKVDDTVQIGVVPKDFVERLLVGDIDLSELWPLPANQFDAIQGFDGGIIQVIGNDDLVTGFEQGQGRERPDIARSALAGMARTRQLPESKTLQRCQMQLLTQ
jgi:hypothetical protein